MVKAQGKQRSKPQADAKPLAQHPSPLALSCCRSRNGATSSPHASGAWPSPPARPGGGPSPRLWSLGSRRQSRSGGLSTARCTRSATTCLSESGSSFPATISPIGVGSSSESSSCAGHVSCSRNRSALDHLTLLLYYQIDNWMRCQLPYRAFSPLCRLTIAWDNSIIFLLRNYHKSSPALHIR